MTQWKQRRDAGPVSEGTQPRPGASPRRLLRLGRRCLLVLLSGTLFFTLASEAIAMGKMCLFSAVKGVVLDHGKPVDGAMIERSYKWGWNDQTGADATTTDAQGLFSMPAIWGHSFLGSLLPHEPVVRQTILINVAGKSYDAWMFNKGEYAENGELRGRPISLICRLEAEPARHGEVFGICEPQ